VNSTLVSIVTERGVQQQFNLIMTDKPMAAVILFAGGHGALGLKGPSEMKWRGNYLVRSRHRFADHGFPASSGRRAAIDMGKGCVFRPLSGPFSSQIVRCPPAHVVTLPSLKSSCKFNADSRLTTQGHLWKGKNRGTVCNYLQ
jgi:hypothetical protein